MRAANASEAIVERIIATHLRPGIANLAPGTAHWSPPERLVEAALRGDGGYGDIRGEPALLAALREEHGREHVMVTPGANQAFVHALLSTCDVGDEVLLWRPYYFSHLVALQLLGLVPVFADCDERGEPTHDLHQCHQQCSLCSPLRVGLPTPGAAYEHFTYGAAEHASAAELCEAGGGELLLCLRTFSKSYGLAAWRVGHLSYPHQLHDAMLKARDHARSPEIARDCTTRCSRRWDAPPTRTRGGWCSNGWWMCGQALEGLGEAWVREQASGEIWGDLGRSGEVATLEPARAMLWEALAPLRGGGDALQPAGAFYYFVRLPGCSSPGARVLGEGGEGGEAAEEEPSGLLHASRLADCEAEEEAVRRLAAEHELLTLPGSAFGRPGHLRLSYGRLASAEEAEPIAERLFRAAEALRARWGET
ncbi:hypothetical protein EMIHUDRAFT_123208 [Emiliania huxleyi CCMP1516]|uniref:Aminotransferase class I/classII large domain-containing protein n=2 Tax=Emiliania huxleyi TaxID=2903 RepID=A0A0D3K1N8_EMIH1|nr:hypothetical protein EMIHUDRAFT_123208 [Emiliania huxleyi CCMP1516]EOD29673.1 hypothetical protein EMIHUDRAFT_123208 [Emiliania huxleyi CCMP1516]|eukprot:XP_005782102.1 hypothetical protein EMIHUDRAFT_123208 [Emiliania huxleyi CCMP1516]